jgi:hypothetical protein
MTMCPQTNSGEAAELVGRKYRVAVAVREGNGSFERHSGKATELVGP